MHILRDNCVKCLNRKGKQRKHHYCPYKSICKHMYFCLTIRFAHGSASGHHYFCFHIINVRGVHNAYCFARNKWETKICLGLSNWLVDEMNLTLLTYDAGGKLQWSIVSVYVCVIIFDERYHPIRKIWLLFPIISIIRNVCNGNRMM